MVTIYGLVCHATGMAYVGSTKGKPAKRFREHRCLLNSGDHGAVRLVADWRRFGPGQFGLVSLEILVDATLAERRAAELKWMSYYAERDLLYNEHRISMRPSEEAIRKGVAAAHLRPGRRWTPEANEKRRLAQLGKPKGHGAKISATKRAKREQMMR